MNRRLGTRLLGLVAVTVVCSTLAVGAVTAGPSGATPDAPPGISQPQTTPDGFDSTVFRIRLYENRSARWTIQHSRPLANETQVAQFESFAADFRANESTAFENFRVRARQLVSLGQDATGRSMTATGFARDAGVSQLGQTRGVLEMSFVWRNFSRADGQRIEAGDVFDGGMFVGEGQRLEFRRGERLAFVDVQPAPDSMAEQGNLTASESVTWIGERQFADRRPHAALGLRGAVGGSVGGDAADGGSDGDTAGAPAGDGATGSDLLGLLPMLLVGTLLVLAAAGTVAWRRGYLPPGRGQTPTASAGAESRAGADAGSTADTRVSGGGGAAATQVTEEELLSDEDRVLKLLDQNGGRMKQVAIVEKTDWSKSKVSMLLSDMEDDGQISKLRLGRENIISLAGQEPDAAGSPFDEE